MRLRLRVDGELRDALETLSEFEDVTPEEVVSRAVFERYDRTIRENVLNSASPRMVRRWRRDLKRSRTS